jgi:hypothetical protein
VDGAGAQAAETVTVEVTAATSTTTTTAAPGSDTTADVPGFSAGSANGGGLSRTGADIAMGLVAAGLLAGAGQVLVVGSRRRRRSNG